MRKMKIPNRVKGIKQFSVLFVPVSAECNGLGKVVAIFMCIKAIRLIKMRMPFQKRRFYMLGIPVLKRGDTVEK